MRVHTHICLGQSSSWCMCACKVNGDDASRGRAPLRGFVGVGIARALAGAFVAHRSVALPRAAPRAVKRLGRRAAQGGVIPPSTSRSLLGDRALLDARRL